MATQQSESLLDKPAKSLSKTLWLILYVAAVITLSALIASCLIKPTSLFFNHDLCQHALHPPSCLAHVSEVAQAPILATTQDHKLSLLQSILIKCNSRIHKAMDTAKAVKLRINSPTEEAGLRNCEELMDMSVDRVLDSMVALTKKTTVSMRDAHTWLSTVLTNHVTCLDGLEGRARSLMEADVEDLMSRASTSLALLVAVLPPNPKGFIDEPLNEGFPSWMTSKDRRLLESSASEIQVDVVVAKDGSGKFKTVAEAVASAPNNDDETRYVVHVKQGTYEENVKIGKTKKNVMLMGDGKDATIITGSLYRTNVTTTYNTATVAVDGDGFIAKDITFQNTAGAENYQAVALRVSADKSAITRCGVDAYQDSLYAHSGRQFYSESFITGTIDFIFGNAAVVLQSCSIQPRKPMEKQKNMITAQGRTDPNQCTGTSIQNCEIKPSSGFEPEVEKYKTYLGRPWKNYSRTVVMQSNIHSFIDPAGWAEWDETTTDWLKTLYFGEYMNYGDGADTSNRVKWPGYHVITSTAEACQFTVKQFINRDDWLENTGIDFTEGLDCT